jgi:Flp pilus assembly pilin Flp
MTFIAIAIVLVVSQVGDAVKAMYDRVGEAVAND